MTNLARRKALQRLGMGAVAAPMMPAAMARSVANNLVMPAVPQSAAPPTPDAPYEPWTLANMSKRTWRALYRERDKRLMRRNLYRDAMLGVVEADIAGLHSLSPAAKARMQVARTWHRHEEDDRSRAIIFPSQDDDE